MGSSRRRALLLLLILAFTAALGLNAVLELDASPFGQAPLLDEESYLAWAGRILRGEPTGVFYQDPLYPYLLSVWLRLFHGSLLAARATQVVFLVLAVYAVYQLGRRLRGDAVGLVAAACVALYGSVYLDVATLGKEPLLLFVSALSCLLAVHATSSGARAVPWLLLGACFGVLMGLRGNFLALLPLCAIWTWFAARGPAGRKALATGAFLAAAVVTLSPITLHNLRASGELIPTTYGAGTVFYIGNNPAADGTYVRLPFVRGSPLFEGADFTAEAERRAGHALKPGEVSRFWMRQGLDFIRENPAKAGRLFLIKLQLVLNAYEVPGNYSLPCMRALFMPSLAIPFLGFGWLIGPALVGLAILLLRREREPRAGRAGVAFLALFALGYGASLVPFFVLGRYRVPLIPALAIFAAVLATEAAGWIRARAFRPLELSLAAATVLTALAYLPTSRSGREAEELAQCNALAGVTLDDLGRSAEALPYLERAIQLAPGDAEYRYDLGVVQFSLGARDAAEASYREAIRLDPSHGQARFNLALLLIERGHKGEALEQIEEARRAGYQSVDSLIAEGDLLAERGDARGADAAFQSAIQLSPGDPRGYARRITRLAGLGSCAAAREVAALARSRNVALPESTAKELRGACGER